MVVPKEMTKISDTVWEIPQSYKKGMLVPSRIIATKKILDQMDQGVFEQVTNVACLPGIQKYALCMSDGHWGYGFPIGGVAAFDAQTGVISPGGIGFDINCTHPETRVQLQYGTWMTMEKLEKQWSSQRTTFCDKDSFTQKHTNLLCFMKRPELNEIYHIETATGKKIKVTGDHPVLTPNGMIMAKNIKQADKLLVHGFKGVKYTEPSSEKIVTEEEIRKTLRLLKKTNKGNAEKQILSFLKKKRLLELRYNSPQIPVLLKVMGHIFGDGVLGLVNGVTGQFHCYGREEDLQEIKRDLESIGISISRINKRTRNHKIITQYCTSQFTYEEHSIIKKSTALAVLLITLGTPYGRKTEQIYRVPQWIMKAEKWQKRLFLASFFGAELSAPATKRKNKYTFYNLELNMNKSEKLTESAIEFLNDIRLLLSDFEVTSTYPVFVEGNNYKGKISNTKGLRILIQATTNNLLHFFERISYEYQSEKKKLASIAACYLRVKQKVITERKEIRVQAVELYTSGQAPQSIVSSLETMYAPKQFILHSIHDRQKALPRVSFVFESFNDYCNNAEGNSGFVWDKIKKIAREPYQGVVYDITINDASHNFIADNIVISNCGMRLVTTNLTFKEVQPKLKELIDHLFKIVPSGVGSRGFLDVNKAEFREIMETGAKWCIDKGYGWKEDVGRCEAQGCIEWADATKVSDKAVQRGINQLGTLGSGNHYLEIQVAHPNNVFDASAAKTLGIKEPEQVVIMFHCGSRGFGHQIATDYLRVFEDAMKKYNITVLDKELACAPFSSKEGQDYYRAMACAANMAFANRQVILHRIREGFAKVFGRSAEDLGLGLVWDNCHNLARREKYKIDGKMKELIVHRKGATKSFGPGHEELPKEYAKIGSPIILGGSMQTGSYLLTGTKKAEEETFSSTAHGSGRTMSRTQAKHQVRGDQLQQEMWKNGIYVRAMSMSGLAEEAGFAYKNIADVIESVHEAGISKKVVGLVPIGNIKG